MNAQLLIDTAKAMVADDKGLLAMDESNPTCNKRFAKLGIPQTEEARRAYRELIATTSGLGESISGAILYDENVFIQLNCQRVMLEGMILKPNMVLPGLACPHEASVDEVADATVNCLLRTVPAAVPGIATHNVDALRGVAFIVALFGCVVLHELGHALMARRYGIQTRDITLLPIGGIARLEKMPEKPLQEFWVALAGPAVNVVIAVVLMVGLAATGGFTPVEELGVTGGSFWQRLLVLNLILVVFNLLPAFPMDGGRALRALLAMRLGRRRATTIAANVGQGMAILFGIVGFFYNPFLIFIGIFVYLGAQAEAGMVEMQSALAGLRVRDAMMTRFGTLAAQDTLAKAVEELLAGSQQDFPVIENDKPIGILRRNDLVKALSEGRRDDAVAAGMSRDCETVDETASLKSAVESMRERQCATMPVVAGGRIIGLLTLENISEMIMVNAAMDHQGAVHSLPPKLSTQNL